MVIAMKRVGSLVLLFLATAFVVSENCAAADISSYPVNNKEYPADLMRGDGKLRRDVVFLLEPDQASECIEIANRLSERLGELPPLMEEGALNDMQLLQRKNKPQPIHIPHASVIRIAFPEENTAEVDRLIMTQFDEGLTDKAFRFSTPFNKAFVIDDDGDVTIESEELQEPIKSMISSLYKQLKDLCESHKELEIEVLNEGKFSTIHHTICYGAEAQIVVRRPVVEEEELPSKLREGQYGFLGYGELSRDNNLQRLFHITELKSKKE